LYETSAIGLFPRGFVSQTPQPEHDQDCGNCDIEQQDHRQAKDERRKARKNYGESHGYTPTAEPQAPTQCYERAAGEGVQNTFAGLETNQVDTIGQYSLTRVEDVLQRYRDGNSITREKRNVCQGAHIAFLKWKDTAARRARTKLQTRW
jgi:hypothetical protein